MMVMTSPVRRSRSPWGEPLFTPLACHALTVRGVQGRRIGRQAPTG
jgi:hypothetical protein